MEDAVRRAEWITLTDDESIEWVGRPTIITILPQLLVGLLLVVLAVAVAAVLPGTVEGVGQVASVAALVLALVGFAIAAVSYLHWVRIIYAITTEEIYVKRGLISRDVSQVRFEQVQNTTYSQSILERLLSYGTIEVYTAGTHTEDIVFASVRNPARINRILTTLLSRSRGDQRDRDREEVQPRDEPAREPDRRGADRGEVERRDPDRRDPDRR